MIIGIDISQIVYETGVSRYTQDLVRNLLRVDRKNTYKLYAGVWKQKTKIEEYLASLTSEKLRFQEYLKPLPPKLAEIAFNDIRILGIDIFIGKCDIFHTSNWTQPHTHAKKVTTVHDLTPVLYSQYHTKAVIRNFKKNIALITKECQKVIAVSKATKNDLLNYTQIPAEKIEVVYSGIGDQFKPVRKLDIIQQTLKKYQINSDYLLSVATFEPRKNLKRVIAAFKVLSTSSLTLVLVGKYGWGSDSANILQQSGIKSLGFVPDQDLPSLYSAASGFVYVSEYEGFGFPVLEAMSCGCPVITSNVSSLPEVGGEAALLVDPQDTQAIKNAMYRISTDKQLYRDLKHASLKQAETFTWRKTAKKTLAIYRDVLKTS